ncbi:MAG: baseplate J/gp47 family protein, partial [Enterobacteriaceae bacterium]
FDSISSGRDMTAEITQAIATVFFNEAEPGGKIALSTIQTAVAAIPDSTGFIMRKPTANIQLGTGELPVVGKVVIK